MRKRRIAAMCIAYPLATIGAGFGLLQTVFETLALALHVRTEDDLEEN